MEILDQPDSNSQGPKSRSLDDVLKNGYEFQFGDYLGRIFQLLKPTWGYLIGNSAVLFGALIVLEIILILVMMGSVMSMADADSIQADPTGFVGKILLIYGIILIVVLAFVVPMRAGIQVFLHRGTRTGNYSFSDFFEPFRTKWIKLLGLALCIGFISFIWIAIPYYFMITDIVDQASSGNMDEFNSNPFAMFRYMGWMLLGYIPLLYFQVSYSLAIPLLLFKTNDIWTALEGSRKIVCHKGYYWFLFFAFYVVLYILMLSGILACGIGLLLTLNAFALGIFTVYEGIFGLGEEEHSTPVRN